MDCRRHELVSDMTLSPEGGGWGKDQGQEGALQDECACPCIERRRVTAGSFSRGPDAVI